MFPLCQTTVRVSMRTVVFLCMVFSRSWRRANEKTGGPLKDRRLVFCPVVWAYLLSPGHAVAVSVDLMPGTHVGVFVVVSVCPCPVQSSKVVPLPSLKRQ